MQPGDHVKVRRRLYQHHGIATGDGRVVHFTHGKRKKREAVIAETSLEAFCRGAAPSVVRHARPAERDEIVARARSLVGAGAYCLFGANCEDFARYCVTGRASSSQRKLLARAGGAAIGIAGRYLATRLAATALGGPLGWTLGAITVVELAEILVSRHRFARFRAQG